MATDHENRYVPGVAAADLSSYQYHAVRRSGDNAFNICNGFAYHPAGILKNKPDTAGDACEVVTGYTPAVLGDTCTAGQLLMANAVGHLIPRIAGWGACARCEVGGAADQIVEVFFFDAGVLGNIISP